MSAVTRAPETAISPSRRGLWLRGMRLVHWVSGAICLGAMLLFALTGLVLNNPHWMAGPMARHEASLALPAALITALEALPDEGEGALPEPIVTWGAEELRLALAHRSAEFTPDEVYVPLKRPGGDGWITFDRLSNEAILSRSDGGWLVWAADLHKGRDAGPVWGLAIDLIAIGCVLFALSGLGLLWLHARNRPSTWPLALGGLVVPLCIALLFVH